MYSGKTKKRSAIAIEAKRGFVVIVVAAAAVTLLGKWIEWIDQRRMHH